MKNKKGPTLVKFFQDNLAFFTTLDKKHFQYEVGKGENAGIQYFSFFLQCINSFKHNP